jgi:hypothetical protein
LVSHSNVWRERFRDVGFVLYDGLPHNITDYAADRCAEDLKRFLLRHSRSAEVGAARGE